MLKKDNLLNNNNLNNKNEFVDYLPTPAISNLNINQNEISKKEE